MIPFSIIACMARNRVIGREGQIPWSSPSDMAHFRRLTMGHPVIMGRRTYESIGRPLKGRPNIVVSRAFTNESQSLEGDGIGSFVWRMPSLDRALQHAHHIWNQTPFCIGGAQLYETAIHFASTMYLTTLDWDVEGDTFFPEWDASLWNETETVVDGTIAFRTYERARV